MFYIDASEILRFPSEIKISVYISELKVTDNLYQILLHPVHHAMSGVQTHNFSDDRH
jgi:hypothetical protein